MCIVYVGHMNRRSTGCLGQSLDETDVGRCVVVYSQGLPFQRAASFNKLGVQEAFIY